MREAFLCAGSLDMRGFGCTPLVSTNETDVAKAPCVVLNVHLSIFVIIS